MDSFVIRDHFSHDVYGLTYVCSHCGEVVSSRGTDKNKLYTHLLAKHKSKFMKPISVDVRNETFSKRKLSGKHTENGCFENYKNITDELNRVNSANVNVRKGTVVTNNFRDKFTPTRNSVKYRCVSDGLDRDDFSTSSRIDKSSKLQQLVCSLVADGISVSSICKAGAVNDILKQNGFSSSLTEKDVVNFINVQRQIIKNKLQVQLAKSGRNNNCCYIKVQEYFLSHQKIIVNLQFVTTSGFVNSGFIKLNTTDSSITIKNNLIKTFEELGINNTCSVSHILSTESILSKYIGHVLGITYQSCYVEGLNKAVCVCLFDQSFQGEKHTEEVKVKFLNDNSKKDIILTSSNKPVCFLPHFRKLLEIKEAVQFIDESNQKPEVKGDSSKIDYESITKQGDWCALLSMLKLFLQRKCFENSNRYFSEFFSIDSDELRFIYDIKFSLDQMKNAIDAFYKTDCNLLDAENILEHLLQNLSKIGTEFSRQLVTSVGQELDNRRNDKIVELVYFLTDNKRFRKNSASNHPSFDSLVSTAREEISKFSDVTRQEILNTRAHSSPQQRKISNMMRSSVFKGDNFNGFSDYKVVDEVEKEMTDYRRSGRKSEVLERLHSRLLSVVPVATRKEGAFSLRGLEGEAVHSDLNDEMLGGVSFLQLNK